MTIPIDWPAMKTVAESAYMNNAAVWHANGSLAMEMELAHKG